jgi:hypothetical protein
MKGKQIHIQATEMKKKSKIDIPPNSELHGGNPGITVVPNDIKNR